MKCAALPAEVAVTSITELEAPVYIASKGMSAANVTRYATIKTATVKDRRQLVVQLLSS